MRWVPNNVGRREVGAESEPLLATGDIVHRRIWRRGAGPLDIEVAFRRTIGGIRCGANRRWGIFHLHRAMRPQWGYAELIAKRLDIGALDVGRSYHGDGLAGTHYAFLPDLVDRVDRR